MITILQRLLSAACISILILGCVSKPVENAFSIFGHVYRIDSVANQAEFADPFYIVITKDSLFQAFGYWDYSYPYETTLKINDSVAGNSGPEMEKYEISPYQKDLLKVLRHTQNTTIRLLLKSTIRLTNIYE